MVEVQASGDWGGCEQSAEPRRGHIRRRRRNLARLPVSNAYLPVVESLGFQVTCGPSRKAKSSRSWTSTTGPWLQETPWIWT